MEGGETDVASRLHKAHRAFTHLARGFVRKRHGADLRGGHSVIANEMRNTIGEDAGLAAARACKYQ
jgi:hypothetical protein